LKFFDKKKEPKQKKESLLVFLGSK
jgi:hypothetical protein